MPGKATPSRHRWHCLLGPLFMLLCIALIASNALESRSLHNQAYEQHQATYVAGTRQSAQDMEQLLDKVEQAAEALAGAISDASLAPEKYEHALATMLQQDSIFYGGTIAFAPYAFAADRRLYAPYYSKHDGGLEFMYIEQSYDYTDAEQTWFVDAMASGSRWSEPYFDASVGDILMTTYSAVVYRKQADGQRRAVAVVTIDIAIQAIGDAVKRFGLGGNGYAEIVTGSGIYLYSPEQALVLNQASLFDNQRWARDPGFERLQHLLASRDSGVAQLYDPIAGERHWVSVTAIAGTPWHILGNFADDDAAPRTPELRHRLMFIILGAVLLVCAALLYKQPVSPVNAMISWPTAILVSLVLAIGVSQIWRVAMLYSSDKDRETFAVTSTQAVARQARDYNQRASDHLSEKPLVIATGIYIESMKFLGASDIRVVGSIWQKFDRQLHQAIERGVVFPGATRVQMGDPIVIAQGELELVRWQFSGEWRFNHHNWRFPLVKDVFGIGIFPRDIGDNILMLPDVNSYPYLAPSNLPGLSPDVFLLGWNIKNTYFELRPWRHKTSFGLATSLTTETLPELHFSTEMEKAFIHSIISNLTPLAIAMTIAFFTLLISTRDKNRLDVLRTGVGFDIGISTSIFFVVVLSHIGLRQRIVSEEVFYLEYFYLLMYANLIWVCCHSILSGLNVQLLDKVTFGVSAKKAFFPVNFLLIFTFTWLIFYS